MYIVIWCKLMSSHTHSYEFSDCDIVAAVVGQPNVGKSTLFNVLTGKMERVGNFPGTTVAMNIGIKKHKNKNICFVDLPGMYSLKAISIDEKIARDFVLSGKWDVILVLIDLTSGVESFYLALQILQLTNKVVIALTKWDEIQKRRINIDLDNLKKILNTPIIPVSALKKIGIEELLNSLISVAENKNKLVEGFYINYGVLEDFLNNLSKEISSIVKNNKINPRGIAILVTMKSSNLVEILGLSNVIESINRIENVIKIDVEEYIASKLHNFIKTNLSNYVIFKSGNRFDKEVFVYNLFRSPFLGFGIVFATLFSSVFIAFSVNTGFPLTLIFESIGLNDIAKLLEEYSLSGLISYAVDNIKIFAYEALVSFNPILANLIAYGVIEGVGFVLSFIPLILITLMIISIVEDSGLGPLMAISIHRIFARFGLSGRAVYPLMISLGCNVPGVIASRTVLDNFERFQIIASSSFIPCQARLIVMIVMIGYLFPGNPVLQALIVVSIYFGGIVLYLFTSILFRRKIFRVSKSPEFLLELPELRRPSFKVIWWNSWVLTKHFIVRAGTILVILVSIVWILTNFNFSGYVEKPTQSFAFYIGRTIGTIISPIYDLNEENNWVIGFSLVTGFIAKENLLASLIVLTNSEEINSALQSLNLSISQGLAILVFFMYYVPCVATVATIYSETRSMKFTLLVVTYIIALSLLLSFTIYILANTLISVMR